MSTEARIGDAEREAAVSALGEHYAAGRLTKEEYDERAGVAFTARTESELRPLFVDLPLPHGSRRAPAAARPTPVTPPAWARPRPSRRFPVLPLVLLVVGLVLLTKVPWLLLLLVGLLLWSRGPHRSCRR
jgi:hypothetical protein